MRTHRTGAAGFHTKAWLAWLAAALTIVNIIENPFALPVFFAGLAAVAGAFAQPGPSARSFETLIKIGLFFTVIRVVLFCATGHTGDTTLFTLPVLRLPRWLGAFEVGGRVTAEVAVQSGLEGLRLAAVLGCLGAFLAVTDVYRVLRLLPRFLAEAGLVATIALAFVPTMFRASTEIRDAQRLRGHRLRGLRSLLPLALPILASGLERSVTLAESMDARGYGRRLEGAARTEAWARGGALVGVVAIAAGGALFLSDRAERPSLAVLCAGGLALLGSLAALSRTVPRTRMRRERWGAWDGALVIGAAAVAGATFGLRALDASAARYYPYPRAFWPPLHGGALALAAAVALPVVIGAARNRALARASRTFETGAGFHPAARDDRPVGASR